jgi:hypothetical protein
MSKSWNWISIVDTLAGGDITKWDSVQQIEYEQCLIKLSYDNAKDKYTREVNRRIEIQNRGRR